MSVYQSEIFLAELHSLGKAPDRFVINYKVDQTDKLQRLGYLEFFEKVPFSPAILALSF